MKQDPNLVFYINYIAPRKLEIYKIIMNVVRDPHIAEELTQEVMEKAWKYLDTLQERDKYWQWVKSIIRNEIRGYFREKKLRRKYFVEVPFEEIVSEETVDRSVELAEQDVMNLFLRQEAKQLVMELLAQLSDREQDIIRLHLIADISLKDIADIYGIQYGNVRMIYTRGLKKLKKKYLELETGGAVR